ncbi:MAG: ABC transporter transmembrane domain-containing protein, partial [Oceanobacter sp.]
MTGQTEGNTQTEQLDTALICLSIVAGHHGIDVRPERLAHDYATENGPVSRNRFLRIAKDLGLKVKAVRMGWEKLLDLGQGYPVLAPLTNGNMVVVSGVREAAGDNEPERLAVIDPLAGKRGFIYLSREQFSKQWSGEVILLKRVYSLGDENQPFGLRWFIPEILRQRKLFTDIIVAAIFLHFIGLVTPIFFQVVIDKVIVHESYSTLNVLGIGIVVALLFDAILEWLRSFLLLHASSKIDVRVATRTFAHLNSLPLAFFERATAGTLTKHMQQTDAIRQFMTGSLLMTMLDASALLVFLPALFFYSPLLTGVVLGITALIALIILAILPVFRIRLHALYQAEGERQSMLVESLQGMRTVKALSLEPVQRREWDDKAAAAVSMRYRVGKVSNIARTASKFLEKLMSVAIVWVGALAVFDGGLTIGALVAFNMLAG